MIESVMNWRTITPSRIEKLKKYHTDLFGDEMSKEYDECKCPGALRDMLADIKKWIVKNRQ